MIALKGRRFCYERTQHFDVQALQLWTDFQGICHAHVSGNARCPCSIVDSNQPLPAQQDICWSTIARVTASSLVGLHQVNRIGEKDF
jgi:hypothetical protein